MKTFRTRRCRLLGGAALAACLGAAPEAKAAFTYTLLESGANITGSGSGSLNLAAFTYNQDVAAYGGAAIAPGSALLYSMPGAYSRYDLTPFLTVIPGPTNLGSGTGFLFSAVASGDSVGISPSLGRMNVPVGYASGSALSNSFTFTSASFTSLGLTPGTYTWSWGSGATADTFTIQIGPATSVPEPASIALIGIGLLGLGAVRRAGRREAAEMLDD